MTTTTTSAPAAISLDRFRRRARAAVGIGSPSSSDQHPMVGTRLGVVVRRHGLMTTEEVVEIRDVLATSPDLAVADRLGFVEATQRLEPIVVIEHDGWYLACRTERQLDVNLLRNLRVDASAPRIMSIVSDRGITPALGPLSA